MVLSLSRHRPVAPRSLVVERDAPVVVRLDLRRHLRTVAPLAVTLAVANLAVVALHLWHVSWAVYGRDVPAWVQDPAASLEQDGALGEQLGYVSIAASAVLLLAVALRRRSAPVLAAWAALLLVVVVDDSMQIHERGGNRFTQYLPLRPWFGLREQDYGELLVWAGLAAVLLPLLVLAHVRSDAWARSCSWALLGCLVALGAVGVVVDMVHMLPMRQGIAVTLGVVEDGGEVVVASAVLVLSALVYAAAGAAARPHLRFARQRRGEHGSSVS